MPDKPAHWPLDVEPLVIEEFEKLGRNTRNELFWDGQPLVTRSQSWLGCPAGIIAPVATPPTAGH